MHPTDTVDWSRSDWRVYHEIEAVAQRKPESTALVAPEGKFSYGELISLAQRVARTLVERGIGPNDIVALRAPRSAAFVVGALGILKTGAAYLPIDPAYPSQRVRFILEDSKVSIILCHEKPPSGVESQIDILGINLSPLTEARAPRRPEFPEQSSDAAYVVYTSGSTGEPKGAVISHAGLNNLVRWHVRTFGVTEQDRSTQFASPGFDAAVWEVWPPLAAGGTLYVVADELRADPPGLRDWLVSEQISVSFVPTVLAEELIDLPWPPASSLRFLLTGGSALSHRPRPGLPFQLVNNYGLSETTVVSTSGIVYPGKPSDTPTIGREIDGVTLSIVDDQMQSVDPGTPGELLIGGVSVGLGYLGHPELTAERFVADRHGRGERLYRSGDLVRRRPDGEIEFLGRVDDQLSVRGFRIEPGEVAAVLQRHPAVRASYVTGQDREGQVVGLVAYLVGSGARLPTDEGLQRHLSSALPKYMVPSTFVWMDRLPLDTHGKVDRRALPTLPATAAHELGTGTESVIGSIVCELLGRSTVELTANFFLLGGHSMLGAELIARIASIYSVQLPLRTVFDGPSVAEIASEVDQRREALGLAEAVEDSTTRR